MTSGHVTSKLTMSDEIVMTNGHITSKLTTWIKVVWFVCASCAALVAAAYMIYTLSGSQQWELVDEQNDVRVYSLKSPGSALKQFKGVVRVQSTLNGVVAMANDPKTMPQIGTNSIRYLGGTPHLQYVTFRLETHPWLFRPREHIISAVMHQDPRTKEVLYVIRAISDRLPPNDCCVRVTDMNNSWRFSHVGNGEVEIEWIINEDLAGFMPAVVQNRKWPKLMFGFLGTLKAQVGRYQARTVRYITE